MSRDGFDETEGFFLALALIFNDLKGVVWLVLMLGEFREPPHEASPREGQISGVQSQAIRFAVGIVNELLVLIRGHKGVSRGPTMLRVLERAGRDARRHWEAIVALAIDGKESKFVSALASVRANVAFHYHQTKPLVAGYQQHFYERDRQPDNEAAFVSLGRSMTQTRFYFADAAAIAAFTLSAGKALPEAEFIPRLSEAIGDVNQALAQVLAAYVLVRESTNLRSRRKKG